MVPGIAAFLCCAFFVIPCLLVVGAGILRGAVSLTNRCLGTVPRAAAEIDDDVLDEWIGYRQMKHTITTEGISELGIGKGMLCVLLLALVNFLAGVLMQIICGVGIASDYGGSTSNQILLFVELISLILDFPLAAWIFSSMLSTKYGRGCLVLLIYYLIIFLIFGGLFVFIRMLF